MWPKTKNFKMATGPKAGLYQNAQSASYLPLTLISRSLYEKSHVFVALDWASTIMVILLHHCFGSDLVFPLRSENFLILFCLRRGIHWVPLRSTLGKKSFRFSKFNFQHLKIELEKRGVKLLNMQMFDFQCKDELASPCVEKLSEFLKRFSPGVRKPSDYSCTIKRQQRSYSPSSPIATFDKWWENLIKNQCGILDVGVKFA